jgi:alpha-beta hydrolase superfamily lysophospholipase
VSGTIVFVHGLGEHSGRYERLARELRADGWSTILYDQRGHGRTPGPRGALPHDTALLEDLATMLDQADVRPLVLFGHSMGGLVAARFVAEALSEHPASWSRNVDALVLSSPALSAKLKWTDRLKLAIGKRLAPDKVLRNGLDATKISHDPEVVRAYQSDPLVHDKVTPRLVSFILDGGELVREGASRWRVPTLLLWAGDDFLVDARGSEQFAATAPRDVVRSQVFPGLYHEIFNESEPGRGEVVAELRKWLTGVG